MWRSPQLSLVTHALSYYLFDKYFIFHRCKISPLVCTSLCVAKESIHFYFNASISCLTSSICQLPILAGPNSFTAPYVGQFSLSLSNTYSYFLYISPISNYFSLPSSLSCEYMLSPVPEQNSLSTRVPLRHDATSTSFTGCTEMDFRRLSGVNLCRVPHPDMRSV